MNAARKLVLLVLVVMLTIQGCASSLRCLDGGGAAGPTPIAFLSDAGDSGGLEQTRHGHGARAAIYAAVGILIIGAFVVDLFILPYSCYHRRHYFPLCTGLIHWCH
jgi:uncharacterized protein YceK